MADDRNLHVDGMLAMGPEEEIPDQEFIRCLLKLIRSEFGREGLARFSRIYCSNYTDYTRDRHLWLSGLTLEDIMEDLQEFESRRHPSGSESASPP